MNRPPILATYNPRRLGDDDFLAGFVARQPLAQHLLNVLRRSPPEGHVEPQLLIGARGMGKTSLLRRVALGVVDDPALAARFLPLNFREEQYNVLSLAHLWRNCLDALAEWCDRNDRPLDAQAIDRMLAGWTPDAAVQGEAFLAACARIGRRPLLLVDNLDLILDALGDDEAWALRRALQTTGGPVMFGASTRQLSQAAKRGAPFYEFFQPHVLDPLQIDEVIDCLRRLAHARGEAGGRSLALLNGEPERVRVLHRLTGGNPRIVAFIYRLLEDAAGASVLDDLEVLLEEVTPYYKHRIETYATDLQRAVIDAVALAWDPITAGELAKITGKPVTTISSQLSRFQRDGLIEEAARSEARSGYQLVERFLNIWYLMRHGTRSTRNRVIWLTEFLRSWYSPGELESLVAQATTPSGAGAWRSLYAEALQAAMPSARPERPAASVACHSIRDQMGAPSDSAEPATPTSSDVEALTRQGVEAFEAKNFVEALSAFDAVVSRFTVQTPPEDHSALARSLVNRGITLGALGRSEEEVAVYDDVVSRFGDAPEAALREQVAKALVNKGVALGALGRSEDGVAIYDDVVARFGDAPEAALREQVARALANKGVSLGDLGRSEEAIAVYEDVVARFGDAPEAALREHVGMALVNKGVRLGALGRSEEAVALYDDVVTRFGDAPEAALREQVAMALFNKGNRLRDLGRGEDAVAVYDDVVARFGDAPEAALREQVAMALFNKGFRLGDLGRSEEAIAVCDEVVARFGDAPEAALREWVARALFNKGVRLGDLGRSEDEVAVYDEVVARCGDAPEATLREQVARALFNKGVTLGALGRSEDAVAIYDDVVARFGDAPEAALREQVARALVIKGVSLDSFGRHEDAVAVYDQAIPRLVTTEDPSLHALIAPVTARSGFLHVERLGEPRRGAERLMRALELADDPELKARVRGDLCWALAESMQIDAMTTQLAEAQSEGEAEPDGLKLALAMISSGSWGADLPSDALDQLRPQSLIRLSRLAVRLDRGEELLQVFEQSGADLRLAPTYAALRAVVRGKALLQDVNVEVRRTAEEIYPSIALGLGVREDVNPARRKKAGRRRRPRG